MGDVGGLFAWNIRREPSANYFILFFLGFSFSSSLFSFPFFLVFSSSRSLILLCSEYQVPVPYIYSLTHSLARSLARSGLLLQSSSSDCSSFLRSFSPFSVRMAPLRSAAAAPKPSPRDPHPFSSPARKFRKFHCPVCCAPSNWESTLPVKYMVLPAVPRAFIEPFVALAHR